MNGCELVKCTSWDGVRCTDVNPICRMRGIEGVIDEKDAEITRILSTLAEKEAEITKVTKENGRLSEEWQKVHAWNMELVAEHYDLKAEITHLKEEMEGLERDKDDAMVFVRSLMALLLGNPYVRDNPEGYWLTKLQELYRDFGPDIIGQITLLKECIKEKEKEIKYWKLVGTDNTVINSQQIVIDDLHAEIARLKKVIEAQSKGLAMDDKKFEEMDAEITRLNGLLKEAREVYERWAEIAYPDGAEFIEFWEDAFPTLKKIGEV